MQIVTVRAISPNMHDLVMQTHRSSLVQVGREAGLTDPVILPPVELNTVASPRPQFSDAILCRQASFGPTLALQLLLHTQLQ